MLRAAMNLVRGRPVLAIFDVTKLCNQRCAMCNIWKTRSDDMDLSAIQTALDGLSRFGVRFVFLQGGEPTLRADLIGIVDACVTRGLKPTVISNGVLLDDDLAGAIAERRCNLAISLDTLDRAAYRAIRGVDKLDEVVANITRAARFTRNKRGNWAVTTTVTRHSTLAGVKALEEFAAAGGFMYAARPYVFVRGVAGRENQELKAERGEAVSIFEYLLERARRRNYLASLIYEEHLRYLRGEPMPPCDALRYSMLLKEDGRLAPCIEFPDRQVSLESFDNDRRALQPLLRGCNADTPCFYNDAREIGVLWRKKWRALWHWPRIVRQLAAYGNFF
jgi:MoaA/NifB/PqqE/SkfB family radical SAM enzyme